MGPAYGGDLDSRDALEPDTLPRIVGMRDHERHADAMRKQHTQAARADVMVGEYDCGGRSAQTRLAITAFASASRSSIAAIV